MKTGHDNSKPDYIVVIRSSEERTRQVCEQIVRSQTPQATIFDVDIQPFKKAFEKCLEIGTEHSASHKWMITVDADMFLWPRAIHTLLREARSMPDHYIQLQGQSFDRIMCSLRASGPRIYRISRLAALLELSRQSADDIRPESSVLLKMQEYGYPSRSTSDIICLHDFEQYYRDLYRKVFVHSRKHRSKVPHIIKSNLHQLDSCGECRIMIRAMMDGLLNTEVISIDTRRFEKLSQKALEDLELTEKPPYNPSPDELKRLYEVSKENIKKQSSSLAVTFRNSALIRKTRQVSNLRQVAALFGNHMIKAGNLLVSWSRY